MKNNFIVNHEKKVRGSSVPTYTLLSVSVLWAEIILNEGGVVTSIKSYTVIIEV